MPKGGSRPVSGPPPDPNALRRDRPTDQSGWTTLPAEGRDDDAPDWPLIDVQPREWDLWMYLWSRPQALMWEYYGQHLEVAVFTRKLAEAELPESSVALSTLVRQYADSLGMTTQGMLRNRWRIASSKSDDEGQGDEPDSGNAAQPPQRKSARGRLTVVSNGDGG